MKAKKPLDSLTKTKLIIQGEYLLISLVFLVLGVLKLLGITKTSETRAHVFVIVTLIGSLWIITDFVWSLISPKHRAKVTFIDKIIMFPFGLWLFVYDLISLIRWNNADSWYRYGIGFSFIIIFILYAFQAVFHWFNPTKAVLNIVEEENNEKLKEQANEDKQTDKDN